MNKKGMALIEIMVSMIVLAAAGLAVSATIFVVNSREMRAAAGSSLDLQALSYARETLDLLRNAVSTDTTRGAPLVASATSYPATSTLPASFTAAPINGWRTYLVSTVTGTDIKQVKVTVGWTD